MKLFRNAALVLFCYCILLPSSYAEEESTFDAYPRAATGLNWLAYVRPNGTALRANYTTLNLGLTINFDRFYFDMGEELFGADFLESNGEITGIERKDHAFTLGYIPIPEMSIFLGYTVGEMKNDFDGEFHHDKGFFVGSGYSYLKGKTNYSATLAYADLDGNILNEVDPALNTKGKTTGFSYGVSISGPFRKTMGYKIALKVRQYDYKVNNTNQITNKKITSLVLGIIF